MGVKEKMSLKQTPTYLSPYTRSRQNTNTLSCSNSVSRDRFCSGNPNETGLSTCCTRFQRTLGRQVSSNKLMTVGSVYRQLSAKSKTRLAMNNNNENTRASVEYLKSNRDDSTSANSQRRPIKVLQCKIC